MRGLPGFRSAKRHGDETEAHEFAHRRRRYSLLNEALAVVNAGGRARGRGEEKTCGKEFRFTRARKRRGEKGREGKIKGLGFTRRLCP